MYAIIKSSGRQYQVEPNTVIEVNRLALEQGAGFETDHVLLVDDEGKDPQVGTPYVAGAKVTGTVLEHLRGKKIIVFKHKRRKGYRRTRGHRQELTRVRIDKIELGKSAAKAEPKQAEPKQAEPKQADEAESKQAEPKQAETATKE